MQKLNKLISKCKCSVSLEINNHKEDGYQTVEKYFEDMPWLSKDRNDIDPEILQKMIELNTIVELQFYPDTSVGFYKIYHYDVEMAIDEALLTFNN